MGKPDVPDPPDYTEIAEATEYAADLSFQIAEDQLAWAMEQFEAGLEVTEPVIDELLETMAFTNDIAEADRLRYEEQYQPLEDELIAEAESYASPERIEMEMGRAQAGVAEQTNAAREASQMALESYGVNPNDVRYAALDVDTRTDAAAAGAAAGQQAMLQAEAKGDALRSEALNIGKGYPGQIATAYGTSITAGTGATATQNAATQTASNAMTQPANYMATGTEALDAWGNTINTGYQNEMSAYTAQMNAMSGIGTALGTIGGLVLMAEEGGEVPDPRRYDYRAGGPILQSQSPSRGARPDDVPINASPHEFMLPEWYVRDKGTASIYKDMEKSAQNIAARQGAVPAAPGRSPGPSMHQQLAQRSGGGQGGQPMRRPTQPMQPGVPPPAPGRGAIPPMPRSAPPPRSTGALPVGGRAYTAAAGGEVPRRPLNMQGGGEVDPNYYPVGVDPASGAYIDPVTGQWVIPSAPVPGTPPPVAAPVAPAPVAPIVAGQGSYRRAPETVQPDTGGGLFGGLAQGVSQAQQLRAQQVYSQQQADAIAQQQARAGFQSSAAGAVAPAAAAGATAGAPPVAAPFTGTAAAANGSMPAATGTVPAPRVPVTGTAAAANGVTPAAARPVPDPRVPVAGTAARTVYSPRAAGSTGYPEPRPSTVPPPFSQVDYNSPRRVEGMPSRGGGGSFRAAQDVGIPPYSTPARVPQARPARVPQGRPAAGGTTRAGEPARTPRPRPVTEQAGRSVRPTEMRSRGDVTGREKPVSLKRGQITAEPEFGGAVGRELCPPGAGLHAPQEGEEPAGERRCGGGGRDGAEAQQAEEATQAAGYCRTRPHGHPQSLPPRRGRGGLS